MERIIIVSVLQNLYGKIKEVLLMIWNGAGEEGNGTQIFLAVVAFAVCALFIYLLISFIRAPWKEKIHRLLVLAIAVIIFVVVIWIMLHV